jgi:hypothetical protein
VKKLLDLVFICSSIIFNAAVSALYVGAKLGEMAIVQVSGAIVISLIAPFTLTLLGYARGKSKPKTLISNGVILVYLSLELVLDYILRIPFREILAIHVPYIIVFYAALFSMMGVSLEKDRKMATIVIVTFLILMGCLIYYLLPI